MTHKTFDQLLYEVRFFLANLKCEIATSRFILNARRFSQMLRKGGFNRDQPRDDRGRWTSADSRDGGAAPGSEDDPEFILIGGPDGSSGRPVDLLDEEAAGGHTIKEHTGKSDEYLLARVRGEQGQFGIFAISRKRAGSFPSIEAADKLVNAALADNADVVTAVSAGKRTGGLLRPSSIHRQVRKPLLDHRDLSPTSERHMVWAF